MKKQIGYIFVAAIAISTFIAVTGFFGDQKAPTLKNNNIWTELDSADADKARIPMPSYAPLVRRVEGAVLVISSEVNREQPQFRGFEGNPFGEGIPFPFRFGPPQGRPRPRLSGGSGFMIHPSGYALTNSHVIENATKIKVKVGASAKEYTAEVIGSDADYDVALIKIKSDRKDWPVIPLGDSDKAQVGDPAVAIGNPLGLELSVSSGIVSARGRRDVHPSGRTGLFDFVQIDAPINPGNSGGPLLNAAGEAIGINSAMAQGNGIGFTIPINLVKQILPQLKEKGKASRSYLGVQVQAVETDEAAKALGLTEASGAFVRRVEQNTPASKAGILAGDVIVELGGEPVADANALTLKAALAPAGKTITAKVMRDGKLISLSVTPAPRPGDPEAPVRPGQKSDNKDPEYSTQQLGFAAVTLDDNARRQLGLDKNVEGVRVVGVDNYSNAGDAGISPNDVITHVNGVAIKNAKQLSEVIGKAPASSVLKLKVIHKGETISVLLEKD